MSNSTTLLDTLTSSQAGKETTANAMLDAASPATLWGRRASTTTGLTWGYYGGSIDVDGAITAVANGTVTLTGNTTNYVEVSRGGTVSVSTSGFSAGKVPLYTVVTNSSNVVTSYTDHRAHRPIHGIKPIASVTMGSDANYTATAVEARCDILEVASSVSLTVTRNVVVPVVKGLCYVVFNNTTGAQSIQIIGASGTGVTIANAKRARVYCDGSNWVRETADV